jgi:membrane protein DedA with SNARE-associated domain
MVTASLRNLACLALGVGAATAVNVSLGWQDRPQALIGVAIGLGVYLLALLAIRDWQRRRK